MGLHEFRIHTHFSRRTAGVSPQRTDRLRQPRTRSDSKSLPPSSSLASISALDPREFLLSALRIWNGRRRLVIHLHDVHGELVVGHRTVLVVVT